MLISPIATGYPALKPILQSSGVYSQLCDIDENYCAASDLRLNFMFTVATVITNVSCVLMLMTCFPLKGKCLHYYQGCALPAGSLLDRYGPRTTTIVGSTIFLLGNLSFALGSVKGGQSFRFRLSNVLSGRSRYCVFS
jgi:MFS family permease